MEPRKGDRCWGRPLTPVWATALLPPNWPGGESSAGVEEHGIGPGGPLRNLRGPVVSVEECAGEGSGRAKTRVRGHGGVPAPRERTRGRTDGHRWARTNRSPRDGRQGVREPHSTEEAGEPTLTGPGGGKGALGHGTQGGTDVGITESREHLNATPTDSKPGERGPGAVVSEPGSPRR